MKNVTNEPELYEITLPRAGANEEPDFFVSVNGKNWLIPKGRPCLVPAHICEELRRSERARDAYDAESARRKRS